MGAGTKGREDRLVILIHCQHEDRDVRAGGDDPPGGFDAVEARHIEVHEDDVWLECGSAGDHLLACRGLADDGHALDRREQRTQAIAERRVIVGQHDADLGGVAHAEALPTAGLVGRAQRAAARR